MAKDFSLRPLEDRIVVKANEGEEMTSSGLVIPDTAKEKPVEGTVVAVGPGRFEDGDRVPLDVAVGDKVIYSKYGGTEVKVERRGVPHPVAPATSSPSSAPAASNQPGFGAGARARLSAGPRSISRRRRHHGSRSC